MRDSILVPPGEWPPEKVEAFNRAAPYRGADPALDDTARLLAALVQAEMAVREMSSIAQRAVLERDKARAERDARRDWMAQEIRGVLLARGLSAPDSPKELIATIAQAIDAAAPRED